VWLVRSLIIRGRSEIRPLPRGTSSSLYTIERGMEYNREKEGERESLRIASSVAPVVTGPPGLVVAVLLLIGRVRLFARSAEWEMWRYLDCGAARPYPTTYSVVGHNEEGRSTVHCVSARPIACRPTPLSVPRGAGPGGP